MKYTLKPLVWTNNETRFFDYIIQIKEKEGFQVLVWGYLWQNWENLYSEEYFESLEAAKSAAQKWVEEKTLEAFEIS